MQRQSEKLISLYYLDVLRFKEKHTVGSTLLFKYPCIGYLKKGRAQFLYKGKSCYAEEGDLINIAKDTKYYSIWTGEPDIEFYSINFEFVKPYIFYEYRFQIIKNYPPEVLDEMVGFYENKPYLSIACLYRLLDDLYGKMQKSSETPVGMIIRPAIEYMEENYAIPVTIEELARLCHCSESGLFKYFKTFTGVTPITYKHNIMIQNALDLLVHTDLSIEEISERVGFSSSHYFRRVFFGITGKRPKDVR